MTRRDDKYYRLINTRKWQLLRKRVLTEQPMCQRCQSEGRITLATEVHHRQPVESARTLGGMDRLMYDRDNLVALCHHCHIQVHKEMGRRTKENTRERNRSELERMIDSFFGVDNK